MSASSEFVALCCSQGILLTQGPGSGFECCVLDRRAAGRVRNQADKADSFSNYRKQWWKGAVSVLLEAGSNTAIRIARDCIYGNLYLLLSKNVGTQAEYQPDDDHCLLPSRQIAFASDAVEGVLRFVGDSQGSTGREWWEHSEIERIAQTLAIARLLKVESGLRSS